MMNKYRGRMVQGDYIMENIFHKEGLEKNGKRGTVAIRVALVLCSIKFILAFVSSDINI